MTIGDILAVIAAVFAGAGATWTATILLVSLAFPGKVAQAQEAIVTAPGATLARGLGVFLGVGLIALALGSLHAGPARVLGGALWVGLAALAVIGSAGIACLIGDRIETVGAHMAPFASLTRGAVLYVAAGFLPVVGWFLIAPLALLLSLGGAVSALRTRPKNTSRASESVGVVASPNLPGAGRMKVRRRQVLGLGAAGLGAAWLTGCRSLEQRLTPLELPADALPPATAPVASPAVRASNRLAYGPRPGDVVRLTRMGVPAYLEEQLQPDRLDEPPALTLRVRSLNDTLDADAGLLFDQDDGRVVAALRQATLLRAVYSRRQLYERMVEFWGDHFNIYAFKGQGPR
ncbi:MAG: DUF1800 family protein [Nitrospira sp.]